MKDRVQIPEFTRKVDDRWLRNWCVWLFFQVIPESHMYNSRLSLGLLVSYLLRGHLPMGKMEHNKSNMYRLRDLTRKYYGDVEELSSTGELLSWDDVDQITNQLKDIIDNAEYMPTAFKGQPPMALHHEAMMSAEMTNKVFIHVSKAADLTGLTLRDLYIIILDEDIQLYRNKYGYLYLKRDDLKNLYKD